MGSILGRAELGTTFGGKKIIKRADITFTFEDGTTLRGTYSGEYYSTAAGVFARGQGTVIFDDGYGFRGNFRNNILEGRITVMYPNGATFDLEWRNGSMQGTGTYTDPDGHRATATWINNGKEIELTYENGGVFRGGFTNGEISGKGEYGGY
ncbi:hypothetical protein FACS1894152_3270 [Bacilli bacterium]|nr:hypothetical protein FACS1894152_3270 [Bacilli bacterium]